MCFIQNAWAVAGAHPQVPGEAPFTCRAKLLSAINHPLQDARAHAVEEAARTNAKYHTSRSQQHCKQWATFCYSQ